MSSDSQVALHSQFQFGVSAPGESRERVSEKNLLHDLLDLDWDTQYFSRRHGKVVNKHARSNLIFAQDSQRPCYEEGKGTIVAYSEMPVLEKLKDRIYETFIKQHFDEPIELIAVLALAAGAGAGAGA